MDPKEFKPYIPAEKRMVEMSFKALFLGIVMAIVLGAANAYIGLKAGMTISAIFPAAVVAMAFLKIFKGNILEENIARTTASVGEGLAAGAIFTLPAFIIAGIWDELHYWDSTLVMLAGGILGVLFITVLRKTMVEEADLPYPESVACGAMVKAGQGGQVGAKYLFTSMGFAMLWEFFKNPNGLTIFGDSISHFWKYKISSMTIMGKKLSFSSGFWFHTPYASTALMGIGYIIGMRLAAIAFAGGAFAWLLFVPLLVFMSNDLSSLVTLGSAEWMDLGWAVWFKYVRPFAVGSMILAAVVTLFKLRKALTSGLGSVLKDLTAKKGEKITRSRISHDLSAKLIFPLIAALSLLIMVLYYKFSGNMVASITAGVIMVIAGFLFAAVSGYLVGVIGSSNNPVSGITLSTLVLAALVMVAFGVTGNAGVAVVLGVAGVICCSSAIAGDMLQDLKVGQILGGTPWKMQIAEMIGVIAAAFVLVLPITLLHQTVPGGIGGVHLPAPQAGLMAMLAKGIVTGDMAWPIVILGMVFTLCLVLIEAPSPMLIAVGMYLPFGTVFAIFVGGIIKWIIDRIMEKRKITGSKLEKATNVGILLASGLVAGEALMAVICAIIKSCGGNIPHLAENAWAAMLIFPVVAIILWVYPLKNAK